MGSDLAESDPAHLITGACLTNRAPSTESYEAYILFTIEIRGARDTVSVGRKS